MPGPVFAEGETVALRTVEEGDLDDLQEIVNDPRVRRNVASYEPVTAEDEREWYDSIRERGDVHLLICVDGETVGIVGLNALNETLGKAELGYFVSPDAWGAGYATDAVRTILDYAFGDRRLHKVYADVYEYNDASRRVLEKTRFQREGTHREQAFVDGEYVDVHRYGLLEDEWRERE